MNVIVCKELETALITYPKCGSNTLQKALAVNTYRNKFFDHTWTEHVLNGDKDTIKKFKRLVPEHYRVIAFVRDPVDRWISGFVFMCQTKFNLFFSDISNVKKELANAGDQSYQKFLDTLMTINGHQATLCDVHMTRFLYPLLIIQTMYKNMRMVDVSSMSSVICDIHGAPYTDFGKLNSADQGYSPGFENTDNQAYIPEIRKRFHDLFFDDIWKNWQLNEDSSVNSIRLYLHFEKIIYKAMCDNLTCPVETLKSLYAREVSYLRNGIKDYMEPTLNIYSGITLEYNDNYINDDEIRGLIGSNVWRFGYAK